MTIKDPGDRDWSEADNFDCVVMANGGVVVAQDECKRRGLVYDVPPRRGGHLRVVR